MGRTKRNNVTKIGFNICINEQLTDKRGDLEIAEEETLSFLKR